MPPVFPSESHQKAFYSDVIDEYLRLRPDAAGPDGVIYGYFSHLEIEATASSAVE